MKERGKKQNKIIDKYIGIPLLLFFSIFKFKREKPKIINSVGILITPAMGDTILLQALLHDIKQDTKIRITLFSPKSVLNTVKLIGYYDSVEIIDFFNPFITIKQLRKSNFDIFIDVAQWSRLTALYVFFSKSKYTIGFRTNGQYKHYLFNAKVNHSDKIHEVYNLKNLNEITAKTDFLPTIIFKDIPVAEKTAILHIKSGGYLSFLRELPNDYWIVIINYLMEKGFYIYISGSKADYTFIETLLSKISDRRNIENTAGKINLYETAELLKKCFITISINTGIMHLASAIKCNLIELTGPVNTRRWGPLNKNSVSIASKHCCAPCLNLGFEYKCEDRTGECMKAIDIKKVLSSIDKFIENEPIGIAK